MELQPIPIDTESFELMRTAKEPMLYVDKTAYLHRLITDGQAHKFCYTESNCKRMAE